MFKNITLVLVSKLGSAGLFFFINYLCIWFLSKNDYADFAYFISLVPIIAFLFNLGTNKSYLILQKRGEIAEIEFLSFKLLSCFILSIIFIFIFYLCDIQIYYLYVFIFGLSLALMETHMVVFQTKKAFNCYAIINFSRNLIWLSTFLLLWHYSDTIELVTALNSLLISSVVIVVFSFLSMLFNGSYKYFQDYITITLKLMVVAKNFLWVELSQNLMMRLELWILSFYISLGFFSPSNLANFNAAFSIAFVLPLITNSIYNVLLPNVLTSDIQIVEILWSKKYLLIIVSSVLALIGVVFINVFLPESYIDAQVPFFIICIAVSLSFFTNILQIQLIKNKEESEIKNISLVQLFTAFIFGAPLIYFFGEIGAALSIFSIRMLGLLLTIKAIK